MTTEISRKSPPGERPVADVQAMRVFYQSTLDAMAMSVAVLSPKGVIIAVNASWAQFLADNALSDPGLAIGGNYLDLCRRKADPDSLTIAAALTALIGGGPGPFRLEYPCPWTTGNRWSRMSAVRVGSSTSPFVILSHEDITEQREIRLRQREITGRLLLAEDEERRRLGRELHDGAAQKLAAAKLILGRGQAPEAVAEAQQLLSEAISDLRGISDRLHPPMFDPLGLVAAIRRAVGRFSRETGVAVALSLPEAFPRLARPVEITLFGAAREALDNIRLHSGSPKASLSLQVETDEPCVRLTVRDHGKGGAPAEGDGLAGLRLRVEQLGGSLTLARARPGLTMTVRLPVLPAEADAAGADGG